MTERRTYSREFKLEALRLPETSGRSAAQIERDLGIGAVGLSRWKKQFAEDGEEAFPGQGRRSAEQDRICNSSGRMRSCGRNGTS
jgi:transposase